jgi:hypothetical protein
MAPLSQRASTSGDYTLEGSLGFAKGHGWDQDHIQPDES